MTVAFKDWPGYVGDGTEFCHNRAAWEASGNTTFKGLYANNFGAADNVVGAENFSDPVKTAGAVFWAKGPTSYMGPNKVNIVRYYRVEAGAWAPKAPL